MTRKARVTIEGYDDGDIQWIVVVTRPGEPAPRSIWSRHATRPEAEAGAAAARAYYRDTVRGVEEPLP